MPLIPGDADLAGQVKRLLMVERGLAEFAPNPVERPRLVERLGLGTAIADLPVDAQGLFQVASGFGEIPGQPPNGPEVGEGVGDVEVVRGATGDAQRLL